MRGATRSEANAVLEPLSPAEEQMWFLEQVTPGTRRHHTHAVYEITGPLDPELLRRSLAVLVDRHEALRTVYVRAHGAPRRQVLPAPEIELPCIDCSDGGAVAAERMVLERSAPPFDLAGGPLIRFALARLGPATWWLGLIAHHIICDEWSFAVLEAELAEVYSGLASGAELEQAPPTMRYAEWAERRARLDGAHERDLAYWRAQFENLPPRLPLPTHRAPERPRRFRGRFVELALSPEASASVRIHLRRERVSLFMAGLAAFGALLHRFTRAADLVVGVAAADRDPDSQSIVGLMINTFALRLDLAGDPTFAALCSQAKRVALEAHEHGSVPFHRVVEAVAASRRADDEPLFRVMFQVESPGGPRALAPGIQMSWRAIRPDTSLTDLVVYLRDDGHRIACLWRFDPDVLEESLVAALADAFAALLEGASRSPERTLSRLPLLSPDERVRVLAASVTSDEGPGGQTLADAFAAQVRASPDATALEFGDVRLTYRELDERSDRLARALRAREVGREECVPIYLDQSPERIAAMLAIVKVGAAYVPLDPDFPLRRIERMVEQARARVAITDSALRAGLPSALSAILVDDPGAAEPAASAPHAWNATDRRAWPDGVAAVLFTSGSTGEPKGITLRHDALVRRFHRPSFVEIGPTDRIPHLSSFSFDLASAEIWGTLLNGACLIGIDRLVLLDPAALQREITRRRITCLMLTTAVVHEVARAARAAFAGLRALLFGGAAPDVGALRSILDAGPPAALVNMYGPTETTTLSAAFQVDELDERATAAPFGQPLPGDFIYLLDDALELVPIGAAGEVFIGGAYIARGYLAADLTAERFVPDPFSPRPGARMYRTGDLARRGAGGVLTFLGRVDAQVKIRGHRVEPREIESTLRAHPSIDDALVSVERTAGQEPSLVAYAIPRGGHDHAPPDLLVELRQFVSARLPKYMLPRAFALVDRWPLTTTGKVDLAALPAPDSKADDPDGSRAPEGAIAKQVAAIWADLLAVGHVGLDDDFFEIGGHSLLAVHLVHRLEQAFGVTVPMRAIFDAPTVRALAARIEEESDARPSVPRVVRAPLGGRAPATSAQRSMWYAQRLAPESAAYNVGAHLLLHGALDIGALARTLSEIANRHEALRTCFEEQGGELFQVVRPPRAIELAVEDLSGVEPPRRDALAGARAVSHVREPFDLTAEVPFRASLVRLAPGRHMLLLGFHHAAIDGWSLRIFQRELAELYGLFTGGRSSSLAFPAFRMADVAASEREWFASQDYRRELEYWVQNLEGAPAELSLPFDFPRPVVPSFRGEILPFSAGPEPRLLEALRALGGGRGCTLFMTLLAAFETLLHRLSGQEHILVGTPVANRWHPALGDLIGMLSNTVVVRGDFSGDPSFTTMLDRIRHASVEAYAHQAVPLERVAEALDPARRAAGTPLYHALFVLQERAATPAIPGLRAEARPTPLDLARADLSLGLWEEAGSLVGELEFSTDLFEADTARLLLDQLRALLHAVASNPDEKVSSLPLE
jgi:amino acid adenylation domain-containing protein